MQRILDAISPRMTEPSTYAGIVTFAGTLLGHALLPPAYVDPVSVALSGVAGLVLVLIRERKA